MEGAAGRETIDQLDAAKLDDAVIAEIEAGGFRIEDDLAHRISPLGPGSFQPNHDGNKLATYYAGRKRR